MKSFLKSTMIGMTLLGSAGLVQAVPVNLVLDHIDMVQETEKRGDELYLHVTTYSNQQPSQHFQVPEYPLHWFSDALDTIEDVNLLSYELGDDEVLEVLVSFNEQDVPPWNVDDLLGALKVIVKARSGHYEADWQVFAEEGITEEIKATERFVHEFKMTGEHGDYRLGFRLD